ncbi:MAG: aminomethyl transferase family protein [Candidatus Rokubacteria bacterium]|nr:aminomethyl transferase family protein [Candidatus Rokubacteria bacterium]
MTNHLPLHTVHAQLGAVFDSPCGWELPFSYGDPAAEYRAVRTAAGLVDRSSCGVVEVTGRDRVSFLQAMLTNDLKVLAPGQGCPAAFLDAHGKVQALLTVLILEDRLLLVFGSGSADRTLQALDKFLISEKASLRDVSADSARFMLAGPNTAVIIERLTGEPPLPGPWAHAERTVGGIPLRVVTGGGETGEAEAWLHAPASGGEAVWAATLEAGKPLGLSPIGVTALDVLRVEAGVPWYGHDVDETVLFPEIPLEPYVSYTKGCYIGQEIVARIKYRGHVNRSLTGLTFDGDRVPPSGAAVEVDGRQVGSVRSAVGSLALNRPIALAYVRREHLDPGTAVTVKDNELTLAARVTALPFYRRGSQ